MLDFVALVLYFNFTCFCFWYYLIILSRCISSRSLPLFFSIQKNKFDCLFLFQIHNISSMHVRATGVSLISCHLLNCMILLEVILWMIHVLLRLTFLCVKIWIGHMIQKRKLVMLDWKTKELHVIWILCFKHCTTFLISERLPSSI